MTHYELLAVPMDASTEEIRRGFREKAHALHPDRFANLGESKQQQAERARVFQQLREAYETLIDKRKRLAYDRAIRVPQGLADLVRLPEGRRAMARLLPRAPKQAQDGEDQLVVIETSIALLRTGGVLEMGEILPPDFDPLHVPIDVIDMPWARLGELGNPGENEGNRGDLYLLLIPSTS